jgi:hypothetical protein
MADQEFAKMNPAIKAKWVAALRSGEYKQGKAYLNGPGGFCCLGVLCDLMVKEGDAPDWAANPEGEKSVFANWLTTLPPHVAIWAELQHDEFGPRIGPNEESLAALNDGGMPFTQIAALIEEKL